MTRSEALKSYWEVVHGIRHKTGEAISEIRRGLKGKIVLTRIRKKLGGPEYAYLVRPRFGRFGSPVIVTSDQPASRKEVMDMALSIYNANVYNYDDDGGVWEDKHLVLIGGTRGNHNLEGEVLKWEAGQA